MGDNLYSDSAIAVNADTGKLAWYFQFTPWDVHDWDAIQVPILADMEFDGRTRKLMLWANRNAFYYTLDRATGEFLVGTPFAKQTWAEGLDENGRPIRAPGKLPTRRERRLTFDRRRHQLVVGRVQPRDRALLRERLRRRAEVLHPRAGVPRRRAVHRRRRHVRAASRQVPKRHQSTRPSDGRAPVGVSRSNRARRRGLLATAGDLVFGGSVDGYFYALDAETGEELWHIPLGALVHTAPMTYAVGGRQFVTITSGNTVFTFGLD